MTVAIVSLGIVVVVGLLGWLSRANPGWSEGVPLLVSRHGSGSVTGRVPELRAWEAEILAASTGGPRGRARLARHLEPVLSAALRDTRGLSIDDPEAVALLGDEWVFLQGGPAPADRPRITVDRALSRVLERVDQRPSRQRA
jgi:hypothetical protein